MRSVVKHRYLKGKLCRSKAKAHIKYLEHRDGHDRPSGGRRFFDGKEDGITGKQIRAELDQTDPMVVHKLVLSPGVDNVDMKAYTREVMAELERHKGKELEWRAVDHQNTHHGHGHVLLYAKEGERVLLSKNDYLIMRQAGDRYLEREHNLERYIGDRQLEKVLQGPAFEREGDKVYQGLVDDLMGRSKESFDNETEDDKKKRLEKEAQDLDEIRKVNADITKNYKPATDRQPSKGREQYMQEGRGRFTEAHLDYRHAQEVKNLQDLALQNPDQAQDIEKQIEALNQQHLEHKADIKPWREFIDLVGYDLEELGKKEDLTLEESSNLPEVKDPLLGVEENSPMADLEVSSSDDYPDFDYSQDDEVTDAMDASTEITLQQEFFENSEQSRDEPEIDDGFDRGLG